MNQYLRDETGDLKKLRASANEWRLRVGDWRIFLTFHDDGAVLILRVLNRRDAYD